MTILSKTTQKFLVSGIPPSNGGVGRLMKMMVPRAQEHGYSIICKRENKSIRRLLDNKNIFLGVKELVERIFNNIVFHIKSSLIKKSIVLILHPQTIGFNTFLKIIKRNTVYFYVMDNSFFCLRSYNIHPITKKECLICVTNPANALKECMPFPVNYQRADNIEYLKTLKGVSQKVFFLAQNKKQKELLDLHFGAGISCTIVGLDTGEVDFQSTKSPFTQLHDTPYDLVYHGVENFAKGIGYFVELAILLPEFSCFLPCSQLIVENILGKKVTEKNIIFKECTWETGLKNAVTSARLVINPSLWSYPIEGALLKSIFYNGNVAVVETEYGFAQEIISESDVLCLPINLSIAAKKVRFFLNDNIDISLNNKTWLKSFLLRTNSDDIFHLMEK
ncbi:MAG: hypothetical protein H7325_06685 [Pedobacter sp.]|nr:hypothetical protein [Pedobacter sp.]